MPSDPMDEPLLPHKIPFSWGEFAGLVAATVLAGFISYLVWSSR